MHVNGPVGGGHLPTPLDEAQGKTAALTRRADVAARRDAAGSVRQHIMAAHIAARRDGHVAGGGAEGAGARVEFRLVVIVRHRQVAPDIAAGVDGDIAPRHGADPAEVGGHLVIGGLQLTEDKAVVVAPGVHLPELRGDVDGAAADGADSVVPRVARAVGIRIPGVDDDLVGRPHADIAVLRLQVGVPVEIHPRGARGGCAGEVLRAGGEAHTPVPARDNRGLIVENDAVARREAEQGRGAGITQPPNRIQRDVVIRRQGDRVQPAVQIGAERIHEGVVQRQIIRIQPEAPAVVARGGVAVDLGLQGGQRGGGKLHLTAITALRPARHTDRGTGLIVERVAALDRHRAARAHALVIPARRDHRICAQVHRVRRDQFDHAVHVADGIGLRQSALIYHAGLESDRPAVRRQAAGVVHRAGGQGDFGAEPAPVRAGGEEDVVPGDQADGTTGGGDASLVVHLLGDQIGGATIADVDLAVINNARGGGQCAEIPSPTRGEVGDGRRAGGHHQAMGVDRRLAADGEAGGVLQNHQAIGIQCSQDLGGIGVVDLIPNDGAGGGLNKGRGLPQADVEVLPAQHRLIRRLDGGHRTLRGHLCRAQVHHRSDGGGGVPQQRAATKAQQEHQAPAAAGAAAGRPLLQMPKGSPFHKFFWGGWSGPRAGQNWAVRLKSKRGSPALVAPASSSGQENSRRASQFGPSVPTPPKPTPHRDVWGARPWGSSK